MLTRFSDFRDWPFGSPSAFRTLGAFDVLRQLDRLFGEPEAWDARSGFPRMSFDDQGTAYLVRAEVPGLAQNELEISATANTLTLRGERKVEPPQGYSTHRSERTAYRFARTFELPSKVDSDRVDARLENGVLTVTLPKAPEAQPKQVTIKAS